MISNVLNLIRMHKIKSVLDIGCNVGDFSYAIKQVYPDIKIIGVEANRNCENDLKNKNIEYKIECLSDKEEDVNFYITNLTDGKCTGASFLKEKHGIHYQEGNYTSQLIRTKTLNNLFKNETFDLIKLDTQGSELKIINGGLDLILKSKFIILETNIIQYNENAPLQEEVFSFLKNINFTPYLKIGESKFPDGRIFQEDYIFKKVYNAAE